MEENKIEDIDKMKSNLDLYLTEISMELMGNRIYDMNGTRQGRLLPLFQAQPTSEKLSPLFENSNDFLCSLGFHSDYSQKNIKDLFERQLDFILSTSNSCAGDNNEILKCLHAYKEDQDLLVQEIADFNLRRQYETAKIVEDLNKKKSEAIDEHLAKTKSDDDIEKFSESHFMDEKSDMMKECMDLIRLMKYIIQDDHNKKQRGELVSYIHTMRTARMEKGKEMTRKPYHRANMK